MLTGTILGLAHLPMDRDAEAAVVNVHNAFHAGSLGSPLRNTAAAEWEELSPELHDVRTTNTHAAKTALAAEMRFRRMLPCLHERGGPIQSGRERNQASHLCFGSLYDVRHLARCCAQEPVQDGPPAGDHLLSSHQGTTR